MAKKLAMGSTVKVPWGLGEEIEGTVVEVWGDPPAHIRVQLRLPGDDDAEPVVLLLAPSDLSAA